MAGAGAAFTGLLLVAAAFWPCLAEPRGRGHAKVPESTGLSPNQPSQEREGKVFSLFNIVTFRNEPCSSTSVLSGSSRRNGTCLTSTECSDRGGTQSGRCAAGFGVCCVFIVTGTSATISQNCTYLQNPGFPSTYTDTTAITYTIQKCDNTVCDLRLDFEVFTTVGTGLTTEVNGGACMDTLVITGNTNNRVPTICGQNSGQHAYVDIGTGSSDTVTLTLSFSGTSTVRTWEIKVTQVKCGSRSRPPNGCLQYYEGLTGRITSFNFIPTSGDNHLASQEYSTCIRAEEGFCCVQYSLCADMNSFTLFNDQANSRIDTDCLEDFITISGAMATCSQIANTAVVSRFCGNQLNTVRDLATSIPVCDCSTPFLVGITTDATTETGTANTRVSRGVCLEYTQIPCSA